MTSDHVPGLQTSKTEALLAPTSSQYPPAAHALQAVLPLAIAKVPAAQETHAVEPTSVWYLPLR